MATFPQTHVHPSPRAERSEAWRTGFAVLLWMRKLTATQRARGVTGGQRSGSPATET